MAEIIELIRSEWEDVLADRSVFNGDHDHVQHDIQDFSFLVSQLIEPTIVIITQLAILYIDLKKQKINTYTYEQRIQKEKSIIKDVLDNYNVDIENVDEVIESIIKKLNN